MRLHEKVMQELTDRKQRNYKFSIHHSLSLTHTHTHEKNRKMNTKAAVTPLQMTEVWFLTFHLGRSRNRNLCLCDYVMFSSSEFFIVFCMMTFTLDQVVIQHRTKCIQLLIHAQ